MLVHPWDAAVDDDEWRSWLLDGHDFGQLIAAGRGRDVPVVVPTHFAFDGADRVLVHVHRANPVLAAVAENPTVLVAVVGDYVYIPSTWGAAPGTPPDLGVATSFYTAVQLTCTARVLESEELLELLREQLEHFQPEGGYRPLSVEVPEYAGRLPRIRGLDLTVTSVRAKLKYDGDASPEHRTQTAARLAERGTEADHAARAHLLRRGRG